MTEVELLRKIVNLMLETRAHHEDVNVGAPLHRRTTDNVIEKLMGELYLNETFEDYEREQYIWLCKDALQIPLLFPDEE